MHVGALFDLGDLLLGDAELLGHLAWLFEPERTTVEIYRPGQAMEEQVGQSAVHGEGPVAGFVLELGKVWG